MEKNDALITPGTGVLYCVNFGNYDPLLDSTDYGFMKKNGWDIVLFTDDTSVQSDSIRTVIHVPIKYDDPRKTAKDYKMRPHLYLSDYDISIYIDGRIYPAPELNRINVRRLCKDYNFIIQRHRTRNCLYKEAEKVLGLKLDNESTVKRQVERYRKDGFPENYGLLESRTIIRWHLDDSVAKFGEYWFQMTMNGCRRDQMSFPYAHWKFKRAQRKSPKFYFLPSIPIREGQFTRHLRPWQVENSKQDCKTPVSIVEVTWGERDLTEQFKEIISDTAGLQLYLSKSVPLQHIDRIGSCFRPEKFPTDTKHIPNIVIKTANNGEHVVQVTRIQNHLYVTNDFMLHAQTPAKTKTM
jgi:hypothetical protein